MVSEYLSNDPCSSNPGSSSIPSTRSSPKMTDDPVIRKLMKRINHRPALDDLQPAIEAPAATSSPVRDVKTAPSPSKTSSMNTLGTNENCSSSKSKDLEPSTSTHSRSPSLPGVNRTTSEQSNENDALDCGWTSQQSLPHSLRAFQRSAAGLGKSSGAAGNLVVSPPSSHCRLSPEHSHHGHVDTFRRAAGKGLMQKNDLHSRSLPSLHGNASAGPKGSKLRMGTDSNHQPKQSAQASGDSDMLRVRPLMGWLQAPRAKSPWSAARGPDQRSS